MAEEFRYASGGGESHKRKYEDSPSPVVRRGTGFSLPPDSTAAPPPSYNNVPPPMNEIEQAKQKAQEIAARLLNSADPSKRARVENGGGGVGGLDSLDYGGQKPVGLGHSGPPSIASSGYPGSKKIEIPNGRVGVIIGKGGETIKYLQHESGAKIQVTRDTDTDPTATTRGVELMGTPDQIAKAEQLINDVLSEAEAGGSGIASQRLTGQQPSGAEQFVMTVPNNKVGLVIGKGGETIRNMQARTGARIQVIPLHLPPGDTSKERTVQIDGTSEQIEAAKQLVEEVISQNRMRNQSSMSGGYHQQGYQARPPANWGQPPPMPQPGYGYPPVGPYPGQPPQYNMNQPPYPGYPSQPTAGSYATGWDQSTAPQNQPGAQGGGGYDYYNQQQQPPPGAPTDGSGYGYGQAPAYSQGYGQSGYSAYQSGYGQPQSGYDQQPQGYNSTYGNISNPSQDGNTSQGEANQAPASGQSYNAGGQPTPNPSYPPQPGYGVPPSSQGAYGTTQTPASYDNYGQPQVQKPLTSQPGYTQQQQSPSAQVSSYPPAQSGYPCYGGQTYGAAPGTQPGYGQQQPPQYGSYYGGGYPQPQASSDGSAGANTHGTYDATPKSTQPSGGTATSATAEASSPS